MNTRRIFNKHFIALFLFGAILMLLSGISHAATHYVSTNGAASWAQSTNINTPCSVSTAMSRASAGDVVYFRGGIYNTGESAYEHPIYKPSNSGSSGKPITFIAYPGETPLFNGTANQSQKLCTIFHTGGKDYIVFDGFSIRADNGHGCGRISIDKLGGTQSDHCTIRNCIFNGGDPISNWGDNVECIRLGASTYSLIQNCKIYNCLNTENAHNTSAIKMYDNDYTTVENCEIYNCTGGLYVKRDNDYCVFRYNYIHGCYKGIYGSVYLTNDSINCEVYHNVVANIGYNVYDVDSTEGQVADNWKIYNNTFYSPGSVYGLWLCNGSGYKIYNNIIQGCANNQFVGRGNGCTYAKCDHNQFGMATLSIRTHYYDTNYQNYTSLSAWQSSGELVGGGNPGVGSLASNPKFKNFSGNMNELDDFRLKSDSPCKGAGRNGVDMGADISLVGFSARDGTPPAPPTGLTIQ
jgi:parallel beta-helix repeat protein